MEGNWYDSDDSNGQATTFLNQLFDSVNTGIKWGVEQVKSACPSRRKRSSAVPEAEVKPEPPKEEKIEPEPAQDGTKPCPQRPPCCYIKMQDPCAPCPPERKVELPPCPPRNHYQKPRDSLCGCDLCKKNARAGGRCCDGSYPNLNPAHLDEA